MNLLRFLLASPHRAISTHLIDTDSTPDTLRHKIARHHVAYVYPHFRASVVSLGSNIPNQDRYVVSKNLVGVMDGHGPLGHQVSSFLSHRLKSPHAHTNIQEIVASSEKQLQDDFLHLDAERYPSLLTDSIAARRAILRAHSGSTLCVAGFDGKRWTFGNLGDSQAICVDTFHDQVTLLTQPETIQNPEQQSLLFAAHPGEAKANLVQRNAYVLGRIQPSSVVGDFHLKEPLSTVQKWFDPVVGQSNTHASGYYLTPPYLRSIPTCSVVSLDLESPHVYVVFATDGFWDRVSPDEVKTKLKEVHDMMRLGKYKDGKDTKDVLSPAAHLAEFALQKPFIKNNKYSSKTDWNIIKSCFSKNFRDDLTVVVLQSLDSY